MYSYEQTHTIYIFIQIHAKLIKRIPTYITRIRTYITRIPTYIILCIETISLDYFIVGLHFLKNISQRKLYKNNKVSSNSHKAITNNKKNKKNEEFK